MGYLILAVRFLTIVPVPGHEATGAGALGRAAWWFPAVGVALGSSVEVGELATLIAAASLIHLRVI